MALQGELLSELPLANRLDMRFLASVFKFVHGCVRRFLLILLTGPLVAYGLGEPGVSERVERLGSTPPCNTEPHSKQQLGNLLEIAHRALGLGYRSAPLTCKKRHKISRTSWYRAMCRGAQLRMILVGSLKEEYDRASARFGSYLQLALEVLVLSLTRM